MTALLLAALVAPVLAVEPAQTWCSADETVRFHCTTTKGTWLSLCASADLSADAAQLLVESMDERGDERAGPMALGGMHHHPRWLVDDGDHIVFEEQLERNRLGERGVYAFRDADFESIARDDAMGGFLLLAVDRRQAAVDRAADASAAYAVDRRRQIGVEALAARRLVDDEREQFRQINQRAGRSDFVVPSFFFPAGPTAVVQAH